MIKGIVAAVIGIMMIFAAYIFGTMQGSLPEPVVPDNFGWPKKSIDLDGKGLTVFPADLLSQAQITKLVLSNNQLKSLPAEIGNLSNLEELYLDHNKLEGALPAEIRKMPRLRILVVQNNNMTGIPAEIGQLKNLSRLDYSYNSLDTYPNEIANLKDNLKILDISHNRYSQESYRALKQMLPYTNIIY